MKKKQPNQSLERLNPSLKPAGLLMNISITDRTPKTKVADWNKTSCTKNRKAYLCKRENLKIIFSIFNGFTLKKGIFCTYYGKAFLKL